MFPNIGNFLIIQETLSKYPNQKMTRWRDSVGCDGLLTAEAEKRRAFSGNGRKESSPEFATLSLLFINGPFYSNSEKTLAFREMCNIICNG